MPDLLSGRELRSELRGGASRTPNSQSLVVLLDEDAVVSGRGAKLLSPEQADKIWHTEEKQDEEQGQEVVAAEVQ